MNAILVIAITSILVCLIIYYALWKNPVLLYTNDEETQIRAIISKKTLPPRLPQPPKNSFTYAATLPPLPPTYVPVISNTRIV